MNRGRASENDLVPVVLEMMDYVSRNSGLSITDAYVEASATTSLSERDKDIIQAYLARRTLIEAFSEETVGEEQLPPLLMPGSLHTRSL